MKFVITTYGALLKCNDVKDGLVNVSDPDAIDAGQYISTDEVACYFEGYRVKDFLPEYCSIVRVITEAGCDTQTVFEDGRFEYDLECEEKVSVVGMGTADKVILWGNPDNCF